MNDNAPTKAEAKFEDAIDKAFEARWWDTHDNVSVTAYWMADNGYTVEDLAMLVEKPWKWTECYVLAMVEVRMNGGKEAYLDPEEPDVDGVLLKLPPVTPSFTFDDTGRCIQHGRLDCSWCDEPYIDEDMLRDDR